MPIRKIIVILAVAAATTLPALAQSTKITGHVNDDSGQPVAGAVVRLEASDGSLDLETRSKKKGQYFFAMVRRGKWRLAAESEGMRVAQVEATGRDPDGRVTFEFTGTVEPGSALPEFEVGDNDTVTFDMTLAKATGGGGEFGTGVALMETGEIVDLIQSGKIDRAREEISRSLEAAPDEAKLHYLLAYLEMQEDNRPAAERAIDGALARDPAFPGAHLLKGVLLEEDGDSDAALAEFREEARVAEDPQLRRDAWIRIATLARRLQRDGDAAEALKRIIEIDPANSTAYAQLIDLYTRTDQREALSALLEQAPADVRDDPAIHFNLGASLYNDGDAAGAAAALERTLEIDPGMPEAHRLLGYCRVNLGDFAGAVAEFERYVELAPQAPDAAEIRELISALGQQVGK